MTGVASFLDAAISNSRNRGMPSVTFASPRPAKWNVFKVICVDGSPTDCAATHPTASPGTASELRYRRFISFLNSSVDIPVALGKDLETEEEPAVVSSLLFVPEALEALEALLLPLPLAAPIVTSASSKKYPGCFETRNFSRSSTNFSGNTPRVVPVG